MSLLNFGTQVTTIFENDLKTNVLLCLGAERITLRELETAEDQLLVALVLSANQKAFEILLRRYQKLVYNVIFQMVQNHEAAADLTQETFLKTYKNLSSFRNTSSFKPWLLKIASNTAINHLRDNKRRGTSSLEEILEATPQAEPISTDQLEEQVELHISQSYLSEAIAALPVRQRQIFILRYKHDFSYADISSITDETESSIKSLLYRIREKLRKTLFEKENMTS